MHLHAAIAFRALDADLRRERRAGAGFCARDNSRRQSCRNGRRGMGRKINPRLIMEEWPNLLRIFVSLALKTTTQSIIVGKLNAALVQFDGNMFFLSHESFMPFACGKFHPPTAAFRSRPKRQRGLLGS